MVVTVPQSLSYVTLGALDMRTLRAFYGSLGWTERPGSDDAFTTFDAGGVLLALYPIEHLAAEAAPNESLPQTGWNGTTLGINVESIAAVDDAFAAAQAAGGQPVTSPVRREWGGYSAYFADPEGNRWELTWAPES